MNKNLKTAKDICNWLIIKRITKKNIGILSGLFLMICFQIVVDTSGHSLSFGEYMFFPSFTGSVIFYIVFLLFWGFAFVFPYCVYFIMIYIYNNVEKPVLIFHVTVGISSIFSFLYYCFYIYEYIRLDNMQFIYLNIFYLTLVVTSLIFSKLLKQYNSIVTSFLFTTWLFSYAFPFVPTALPNML